MPRDFLLRLPAGSLPLGGGRKLHFPDLEIGGTSRIIWRAVFVQAIAWCLGVSQHVIIRGAR